MHRLAAGSSEPALDHHYRVRGATPVTQSNSSTQIMLGVAADCLAAARFCLSETDAAREWIAMALAESPTELVDERICDVRFARGYEVFGRNELAHKHKQAGTSGLCGQNDR